MFFAPALSLRRTPFTHPLTTSPTIATMPVYRDQSVAWPVFVWDTSHMTVIEGTNTLGPDYYVLEVDTSPAFRTPTFAVTTTTIAAAPTIESCCQPFAPGSEYYWRVHAFRDGNQLGVPSRLAHPF